MTVIIGIEGTDIAFYLNLRDRGPEVDTQKTASEKHIGEGNRYTKNYFECKI